MMTTFRIFLVVLIAGSWCCVAQQAPPTSEDQAATRDEIVKLDSELNRQLVTGAWDGYAGHLAADFLYTSRDGTTRSKEQVLADFRSGTTKFLDIQPETMVVHIYGDTAVANGHRTDVIRQNGKVLTHPGRFTETFIRRDGRWWLVALQLTPSAE